MRLWSVKRCFFFIPILSPCFGCMCACVRAFFSRTSHPVKYISLQEKAALEYKKAKKAENKHFGLNKRSSNAPRLSPVVQRKSLGGDKSPRRLSLSPGMAKSKDSLGGSSPGTRRKNSKRSSMGITRSVGGTRSEPGIRQHQAEKRDGQRKLSYPLTAAERKAAKSANRSSSSWQ